MNEISAGAVFVPGRPGELFRWLPFELADALRWSVRRLYLDQGTGHGPQLRPGGGKARALTGTSGAGHRASSEDISLYSGFCRFSSYRSRSNHCRVDGITNSIRTTIGMDIPPTTLRSPSRNATTTGGVRLTDSKATVERHTHFLLVCHLTARAMAITPTTNPTIGMIIKSQEVPAAVPGPNVAIMPMSARKRPPRMARAPCAISSVRAIRAGICMNILPNLYLVERAGHHYCCEAMPGGLPTWD